MKYTFNKGLIDLSPSVTRHFFELAQKTEGAINFGVGEPSYDTPKQIIDASVEALLDGYTHYSSNYGFPELREEIAEKLHIDNGIPVEKANILVTSGGAQALYTALTALVNPGDEVVVFEPGFGLYSSVIKLCGGVPKVVYLHEEEDFSFAIESVNRIITGNTKGIVINTPHNPTGKVFNREQLNQLAGLVQAKDMWVVSDEVYENIVYDDFVHTSIASLPGMGERTVTINSLSKAYAMTGFRLGYAAAPVEVVDQMLKIHQNSIACANTIAQKAAITAIRQRKLLISEMNSLYRDGLDAFMKNIQGIPGIRCYQPQGTFYALVQPCGLSLKGQPLALYLLEKAKIVVVPCTSFSDGDYSFIRFSFCINPEMIAEGLGRFAESLKRITT